MRTEEKSAAGETAAFFPGLFLGDGGAMVDAFRPWSSTWPRRKSSVLAAAGEMELIMCQCPIQSRNDRGRGSSVWMLSFSGEDSVPFPPSAYASTDGRDAALKIVIPLADRGGEEGLSTCPEPEEGDDGEPDRGEVGGFTSAVGVERHPFNTEGDRRGCHGGSEGSGTMLKIDSTSSVESTPSLLESNWWKTAVRNRLADGVSLHEAFKDNPLPSPDDDAVTDSGISRFRSSSYPNIRNILHGTSNLFWPMNTSKMARNPETVNFPFLTTASSAGLFFDTTFFHPAKSLSARGTRNALL
mmetsp:Transcript_41484/g.125669  ORF Transcript_41484/g.125669 Transcript_41484/m.125669 type:complete len:299 (+) Transcript_41484:1082-1978(+)